MKHRLFSAITAGAFLSAAVVLGAPSGEVVASVSSVQITPEIPYRIVDSVGELFYERTFEFTTPDGNGIVSGSTDGSGDVVVDDEIEITVTPAGGAANSRVENHGGSAISPIDISSLLDPGSNTVTVKLRDTYGGVLGSSALYLLGGDSLQPDKTVTSPDYKVVSYLRDFAAPACATDLDRNGIPGGAVICRVIRDTRNRVPNADIASTDGKWNAFKRSREYRSLLHLPRYKVTCDASGRVTAPPIALGQPATSAGWTPIAVVRAIFLAGEKYKGQDGAWGAVDPVVKIADDGKSVHLTYRIATRAGTAELAGDPTIDGYSLPFNWSMIQTDLRCDGAAPTVVSYSQTPSTVIFRNGAQVAESLQSNKWAQFLKTGSRGIPTNGIGNLSTPCRTTAFEITVPGGPDCTNLASSTPNFPGYGGVRGQW